MTVKDFWLNSVVTVSFMKYTVDTGRGAARVITRKHAAELLNDPSVPMEWKIERKLVTDKVTGCPWCNARPMQYERDCDGWASLGTCGSEQCDKLQRCEGCGQDGIRNVGSWRGRLCDHCHEVANLKGLATIPGLYGLFRPEDYREYYA